MKRIAVLATVLAMAWATPAFPSECQQDMVEIDAALANPPKKLNPSALDKVKKYRALGEKQEKAGKFKECFQTLDKAKRILGI
jgi:hypothetical protein